MPSHPIPSRPRAARPGFPHTQMRVGPSWKYGGEGGLRHFAPALPPAANKGLEQAPPLRASIASSPPAGGERVPPPLRPPRFPTHRPPPPERDVPGWGARDPLSRRGLSLPCHGHGPGAVRPLPPARPAASALRAPSPPAMFSAAAPGRCALFPRDRLEGGGKVLHMDEVKSFCHGS